ncbi:MAG TPA: adenylate/guanylate cyclase domain-containing protein [Bacteroidales bacterium]|nr:adenylate/guanylate cyclase domain-containing protein [Bacteroidales bacterium]
MLIYNQYPINKKNIVKNTIFFYFLTIITLLVFSLRTYSQYSVNPYIQRIIVQNYGFENNNYSIIQDKNKIIYVGNSNGILQYNGNTWNQLDISGIPRMDIDMDGIIYVGLDNDFGYIENKGTKSAFISLSDSLNAIKSTFGQINQVFCNQQGVYFCSDNYLFCFNKSGVSLLKESKSKLKLFKVNGHIYLQVLDEGFYKLIQNQIRVIPQSLYFNGKTILDILPYHERLLIKTKEDKGFFIFDNYTVEPFNTQADQFIETNIYTQSRQLNNGDYAIGTQLHGIIIINQQGEIINHIEEISGLYSLTVNALYVDMEDNLWALHDQGISRIEIPSAFSYYSKNHGLRGNIKTLIRFNNKIYVGTSLGIFYMDFTTNENCLKCSRFVPLHDIKSNCHKFHIFNNQLFAITSSGIYEIKDDKAFLFYNRDAGEICSVLHSPNNPYYIYLGLKDGFMAIRYSSGMLIVEKKLEAIPYKVSSIAEDKDGTVWVSCNNHGVYKIPPFKKFHKDLDVEHFSSRTISSKEIHWINLYVLNDGVIFSSNEGLFRYKPEEKNFYADSVIVNEFATMKNWVYPIVEDIHGNIWLNITDKDKKRNKTLVKNMSSDSVQKIMPLPLNRIKDFYITSILPENEKTVWFGGIDGLIKYNVNTNLNPYYKFNTFLSKIVVGKDSVIYNLPFGKPEIKVSEKSIIPYHFNRIVFNFLVNDYKSEGYLLYRYKLDGFDKHWSDWSENNFKEYTNLYEGDYTFHLQAKNIFDKISDEITFNFTIKPPFFRTKIAFVIYLISLLLIFILIGKWRAYYFARERFRLENIIHERTEEVVIQKEKADNLLDRVLPKSTAKELKSGRKAGPYHYNMVTVLFSDIQGFTKISEQMDSEHLIDELDRFFLQFDSVVEKYNIEKIKTIGDAYMCAGGIPIKNRTNPVEVVLAAMEMQNYMKELKQMACDSENHIWDLRIGIDTGPVVAGVLGRSKISYDIWGGTVNTASRMEASGEPGKINITENTYMLIKDFFICQYRGKMPIKYKGEIDMYFVEGFKPHMSSDLKGQVPNASFFTQLQLLRIHDVEEYVLSKLEEGLPDNLYYHNVKHTIDVVTQVELIGRSEGVNDEDMLILKTAALFHDMGHLINYDTHEEESVKLARKLLPEYHYNSNQIERICQLILVTQMPPQPKNMLEEIMCDADLDYLGRTDFVPVSINLYKELAERKKIDSLLEWNHMQSKFIEKHQYFTKTAQKLREVNKKKQLENIQKEIRREMEEGDE